MRVIGRTEKGPIRQENEDAFWTGDLGGEACFAVVCDGMGGEKGGGVASSMATERIAQVIGENFREDMDDNAIRDMLKSAVTSANILIFHRSADNANLHGMGTTVVACVVHRDMAHIAHVGDSRAYMLRDKTIDQITTDHTMVQSFVDQGKITEEEARVHPQKHLITRALGVEENVNIDYYETPFKVGESLLICTDGLTSYFDNDDIFEEARHVDANILVDELVEKSIELGGSDNITVVLVTR